MRMNTRFYEQRLLNMFREMYSFARLNTVALNIELIIGELLKKTFEELTQR